MATGKRESIFVPHMIFLLNSVGPGIPRDWHGTVHTADPGDQGIETADKNCLLVSWLQNLQSLLNCSSLKSLQHFVAAKDSTIFS